MNSTNHNRRRLQNENGRSDGQELQVADVGHGWPGEVQHNQEGFLPRCKGESVRSVLFFMVSVFYLHNNSELI